MMSATHHRYTQHGHACCNLVSGDRPTVIARCGGPARCKQCSLEARMAHALRPFKEPDDTRAADYLAGQKHQRAELCAVIKSWLHISLMQRDDLADFINTLPYSPRLETNDE